MFDNPPISREEAEKMLNSVGKDCFLVRWSPNQNCYVLSYIMTSQKQTFHAPIRMQGGFWWIEGLVISFFYLKQLF
jgi:hypothetical protein